ncbi:NAD-dependent epimerase/dehydratase family protein [Poseidonocella sedimentorum]|uniref:UDP-glucuronate 4-epimerase n=1 Tax=Poseidonocella sedimentorum TaxID=871652 RepID=A0A1I6D479_9RHOB|nr:NAD-dependent epimerase/dehydratase family protein [Poseidonocella sedimentorum]SFR00294.1 UDP-glucuronate 4-epimerase [Poseidonocella sedimentorum]
MKLLVTGSSGFIGYHLVSRLLDQGHEVVGLDALTDYYSVALKQARLAMLDGRSGFRQLPGRVETPGLLRDLLAEERPEVIVHFAGQAGVRHSIEEPRSYLTSNMQGGFELLEAVRAHPVKHLLIASTSSVYGANTEMPYRETDKTDTPMSFYAATKKATEAMGHSYAHLFDIPMTFFRFFTVYGPWGRPDMAPSLFADAILKGRPIKVFNHGDMRRDFTFVTDLVRAVEALIDAAPERGKPVGAHDSLSPVAPHRIVNIGNAEPVRLLDFIGALERALGREAEKILMDIQPGDVPATWAETSLLRDLTGVEMGTSVEAGVAEFAGWFREYHQL